MVTINAGTLLYNASLSTARPIFLGDAASTIDVSAANSVTLTGTFSGTGSLTKGTSGGTLVLSTPISIPTLNDLGGILSNSSNLSANNASVAAGAALNNTSNFSASNFTIAAGGTFTTSTGVSVLGAVTNNGAFNFNSGFGINPLTVSSLAGSGTITVNANLALTNTSITQGNLIVANNATLSGSGGSYVLGAASIGSGSTWNLATNGTAIPLTVTGTLANNGAFTYGAGVGSVGAISGSGSTTVGLIGTPATLTVKGALVQSTLTVNGGAVNVGAPSGATAAMQIAGTITVNDTARLNLVSDPTTTTLGTTPRLTHTANALVLNGTGTLDVGGHNLQLNRGVLDSTDPASVTQTVYQKVVNAYNSPNPGFAPGDWNGPGITSALAKADIALPANSRAGLAIGVWDSTDSQLQTGQPAGTVLIGPTVLGDANGDLFTDNSDFAIWRNNIGNGDHWAQGDFNYDQFVDNSDFAIWRNNVGNSTNFGKAVGKGTTTVFSGSCGQTRRGIQRCRIRPGHPHRQARFGWLSASGSSAAAPSGSGSSAAAALGTVTANIDPTSGDVLVDINLQGTADLASIQFKSVTTNAMNPGAYFGFVSRGTAGWQYSNGSNAGTSKLLLEINVSGQTAFPTETVLDFGNFWNSSVNARNISLVYNTTPHGGGSGIAVSGTVTYGPEPTSLSVLGLGAAGLLGRRRRKERKVQPA